MKCNFVQNVVSRTQINVTLTSSVVVQLPHIVRFVHFYFILSASNKKAMEMQQRALVSLLLRLS